MTSQILANIYLNEFDRFVRHTIKPLAYVRYGDDFVLFMPQADIAQEARTTATQWLQDNLELRVHPKNDVVLKSAHGLFFLGHKIYPHALLSVDAAMLRKIQRDLSYTNAASYSAMSLPRKYAKQLPWLLTHGANS